MSYSKIEYITKISIFSAISFLLMKFLEIPFSFLWSELKYDFADVPALILGFAISPIAGISVVIIRNLLYLITSFNLIGVIANTIVGISYVGISSTIYLKDKKLKTAILGMLFATVITTLIMIPVNLLLVRIFTNGKIPNLEYLVYIIIPIFNLIKCTLNTIITYFLYKRISKFVKLTYY